MLGFFGGFLFLFYSELTALIGQFRGGAKFKSGDHRKFFPVMMEQLSSPKRQFWNDSQLGSALSLHLRM